jgi:hypothetical protein
MIASTPSNRRLTPGVIAVLSLLLSGAGSDAQSPAPPSAAAARGAGNSDNSCHAEVSTKDFHVTQCPMASLHFHVSVSDCQDSQGSFAYEYTQVVPDRKETLQHTAAWIAHGKESDVTERVPASCDAEIDDAQVQRVTRCSCVRR